MKKTVTFVSLIFIVSILLSCNNLFTFSLGKRFARDLDEKFSQASTADIVTWLASLDQIIKAENAKAVINALSGKPASELTSLSPDATAAILNTAATAIISTEALAPILKDIDLNNPANTDTKKIFSEVLAAIDSGVNTAALITLLGNADSVNGVNTADSDALFLATASLLGSMVKSSGKTYTDLETGFTSVTDYTSSNIATALVGVLGGNITDPDITAVANIIAASNPANSASLPTGYNAITLPFGLKFEF